MAKIYGGESAYVKNLQNIRFISWLACLLAFLFLATVFHASLQPTTKLGLLLYVAGFVLLSKIICVATDTQENHFFNARNGLRGEAMVCRMLGTLPDTFEVFRSIQLRERCDIDFVVVGPSGIFSIEVKSHGGNVGFNGIELTRNGYAFKEKNFLHQAMTEALDVHDYLLDTISRDTFVTPMVVFSNKQSYVRFGQKPVRNVKVIKKEWLLDLIVNTQTRLSPGDVEAATAALARLV